MLKEIKENGDGIHRCNACKKEFVRKRKAQQAWTRKNKPESYCQTACQPRGNQVMP